MTSQVIPAEAVEAAARAWVIHSLTPGSMTLEDGMRDILEAAVPHMLAGAWDEGWDTLAGFDSRGHK